MFGNIPTEEDTFLMRETVDAVVEEVLLIGEDGAVLTRKLTRLCAVANNEFWTIGPIIIPEKRFFIVS